MATTTTTHLEEALEAIKANKYWPPGLNFDWKSQSIKRWPAPHSLRIPLALDPQGKVFAEGQFIDMHFKRSVIHRVPDTLSISFMNNCVRAIGIDDNGVKTHTNKVGIGLEYYMRPVGFPHLHHPAQDGIYGYAKPLARLDAKELWAIFLKEANIIGAPPFELPDRGQLDLDL